jgi:hypothetical protein
MLLLSSPLDAGRLRIRKNQEKLDTAGQENINLECSASPLLPGCIYELMDVLTHEKREREKEIETNANRTPTVTDERPTYINLK